MSELTELERAVVEAAIIHVTAYPPGSHLALQEAVFRLFVEMPKEEFRVAARAAQGRTR